MIGLEQPQRVVAVVADEAVLAAAVTDLVVGVDLPRDAGLLQPLGVGRPVVDGQVVVRVRDRRSAGRAVRVDHPAPVEQPVRRRRALDRAEVLVAERERLGQRAVERDVVAVEVGGAVLAGLGHEARVVPAGPLGVHAAPAVVVAGEVLAVDLLRVDVVRQQVPAVRAGRVGLLEHGAPVGEAQCRLVAEAAHPAHRPVVVVDRPVLLHQDDDVLDVVEGTVATAVAGRGRGRGRRGQGSDQARGRRGGGGTADEGAARRPTRRLRHGCSLIGGFGPAECADAGRPAPGIVVNRW